MDVVHYRFQSVGEPHGVKQQLAVGVPATEKAIINVDEAVASLRHTVDFHGVGLAAYYLVGDVDAISVPGTPPHYGSFGNGSCRRE